jgi:hypothetical protein
VLLRIPGGGGARLADAALELADDADVAAGDDLDVGALDQVEPEVALDEQREAATGGGPTAVEAVAAGLGVLGLLLDGDDPGAATGGEQLRAVALAALGGGLRGGGDGEEGDQTGDQCEGTVHTHDANAGAGLRGPPWGGARLHLGVARDLWR